MILFCLTLQAISPFLTSSVRRGLLLHLQLKTMHPCLLTLFAWVPYNQSHFKILYPLLDASSCHILWIPGKGGDWTLGSPNIAGAGHWVSAPPLLHGYRAATTGVV